MGTSLDYLEYVLDLLRECQMISYKKMMGEYLLYQDNVLFGGIYDHRFLIKKTPLTIEYHLSEEIPYPGAKPMYLVDIENVDEVKTLVELTVRGLRK